VLVRTRARKANLVKASR